MNQAECKISDNPIRQKWYKLSRKGGWSLEFLKKNIEYINWNHALLYNDIDMEILLKIRKNVCWKNVVGSSKNTKKHDMLCAHAIISKIYDNYGHVSEADIRKYKKYLDIDIVLEHNISNLSAKFIDEHSSFVNLNKLCWLSISFKKLPEWFLVKYVKYLSKYMIHLLDHNILSDRFIDKSTGEMSNYDWDKICFKHKYKLSLHMINKYRFKLGFHNIARYQKVDEKFIEDNFSTITNHEHCNSTMAFGGRRCMSDMYVRFHVLFSDSKNFNLMDAFLRNNDVSIELRTFVRSSKQSLINMYKYCKYNKLTQDDIIKIHNILTPIITIINDWFWILMFKYQKFNDKLIVRYRNHINWSLICQYQQITNDTLKKFADLIDYKSLSKNHKFKQKIKHELTNLNVKIHNKLCDVLNYDLIGIVKQYLYV